jgi:hypothetical protein
MVLGSEFSAIKLWRFRFRVWISSCDVFRVWDLGLHVLV